MPSARPSRSILLLSLALLVGGLRDPRLAAVGEAAVFVLVWLERPALGPAVWWLPFLGWLAVSSALSNQPLAGLPIVARWAAALAYMSLAAAWSEREREEWLKLVLGTAAVLGVAALVTGAPHGFRSAMTGLMPPYYNYTAFAVAAATAAAATGKFRAASAAGLVVLLLARSRGACAGLLAAGAYLAVRRWGVKGAVVAGLVALIGGGVMLQKRGRYQDARPEIWRRAAEIASERPLLGAGAGNFGAAFDLRPVEVRGGRARWGLGTPFAHSEPLQEAAETGWLGLALWLAALGASLSALRKPGREAAAAACVAMAVQLLVDNMLQIPALSFLFFSALAVAGAPSSVKAAWPRWAAALGLALAAVAWTPGAIAESSAGRAAMMYPAAAWPQEDLAAASLGASDWGGADYHLDEASRRAPRNAVYPWRRAQLAANGGRWAAALVFATEAAELEPGFLNDRVLRAEALLRLGRKAEARAALAAVKEEAATRESRLGSSGYDNAVWEFDRAGFERVVKVAR